MTAAFSLTMTSYIISARTALLLWTILLPTIAILLPTGYWTIDDSLKSVASRRGEAPWSSPIADGELRSRLTDPAEYAPMAPPFAERIEHGFAPGFTPGARLLARVEALGGRRSLMVLTAAIAVVAGWLLYRAGLSWGFLLLPLTFYGLVPWEHGLALVCSLPLLFLAFLKDRVTTLQGILAGGLIVLAAALRLEHGLLLAAALLALLFARRYGDFLRVVAGAVATGLLVLLVCGYPELMRTWQLNQQAPASRGTLLAAYDTILALGTSPATSAAMVVALLISLWQLARVNSVRVLRIIAWGGVALYGVWVVRGLWSQPWALLSLINMGSLAFALPWVLWLVVQPSVWKQQAMAFATALFIVALLMLPQSQGVHWGPRLLLFVTPLFLIALYRAHLHTRTALTALLLLSAVQSVSGAVMVYARYTESTQHISRLGKHTGTPLITTTRAHALDLAPLWDDHEFFVAGTPDDLRSLLVEFYMQRRDSAWLHLPIADSLFMRTFPDNRPVWPHRMTIVNSGNLYMTHWRLYQLVMNRADPDWVPLLETSAGRALQAGDNKRALFLQDDIVTLVPDRASAHSNFALLLARMGKTQEAQTAVRRALELDSTLAEALELANQLGIGNHPSSAVAKADD